MFELETQVRAARFRHVTVRKREASGPDEVLPAMKEQVVRGFQVVDGADLTPDATVQLDGNVQFVGDASITNALSGIDVRLRSRDSAIFRQIRGHDCSFGGTVA
ncbi:MAG TPA: hypothetical protein VHU80_05680 [Polyangiaceae bacterium]|nr:hypothetical protein [Polyangiaceae bacterium]